MSTFRRIADNVRGMEWALFVAFVCGYVLVTGAMRDCNCRPTVDAAVPDGGTP